MSSETPERNPSAATTALRFNVSIDDVELGSFTAVDGLEAEYDVRAYEEGGENGFVHQLRGRMKWKPLKLVRALNGDSKGIATWFFELQHGASSLGRNATITAYDDNRTVVGEWTFVNVRPIRYTGPGFSVDNAKAAVETLELVHHGPGV